MGPPKLSVSGIFTKNEWDALTRQLGVSPQQGEIARLLLEGSSDKQISRRLGIAVPTVRTYLSRMFSKLDVQDRNELVVMMLRKFRSGCDLARCPRSR